MNRRSFLLLLTAAAATCRADAVPTEAAPPAAQAIRLTLARLGQTDGFYAAPELRIGLHKNLAKAEGFLRAFGLGDKIDDLILASNRTAEVAIHDARDMLYEQLLLATRDLPPVASSEATAAWLRERSFEPLSEKLLPFVHAAAARTDLDRAYQSLYRALQRFSKGESNLAAVEKYVTRQSLEGLYKTLSSIATGPNGQTIPSN